MTARTVRPTLIATTLLMVVLATMLWWRWQGTTSVLAAGHEVVYKVEEGDSLFSIAAEYGVSVEAIIVANPDFPGYLYKSQKLTIPAPSDMSADSSSVEISAPEVVADPMTEPAAAHTVTYKVEEGDSLEHIAKQYGVSVDVLMAANPGQPAYLYVGQKLTIPPQDHTLATSNMAEAAASADASSSSAMTTESQAHNDMSDADMDAQFAIFYVVGAGESLRAIAKRIGLPVEVLLAANPDYPGYLYPGQMLYIPPPAEMYALLDAISADMELTTEMPSAEMPSAEMPSAEVSAAVASKTLEHQVEEGESLQSIAEHYGVSVEALLKANPDFPGYLYKDQNLIIPSNADRMHMDAAMPSEETMPDDTSAESAMQEESMQDDTGTTEEQATGADEAEESAADQPADDASEEAPVAGEEEDGAAEGSDSDMAGDEDAETTTETDADAAVPDETATDEVEADAVEATEETAEPAVIDEVESETEASPDADMADAQATAEEAPDADQQAMASDEADPTSEETVVVSVATPDSAHLTNAWTAMQDQDALFSPASGGAYHSPIEISGLAATTDGMIDIEIVTDKGETIAERAVLGGSAETQAFFHSYLRFSVQEETAAVLYAYDGQAADGATPFAEIPLVLIPGQRIIDVTYPYPGAAVCQTIDVEGYSNTFEANVVVELYYQSDDMAGQVATMGGNLGIYREFTTTFQESLTEPSALLTAVYASDASGRYPHIDRTVIPITVVPGGTERCP